MAPFLPRSYLSESRWRLEGYRRIAEAGNEDDLKKLRLEWRDRHGPWSVLAVGAIVARYGASRSPASEARIALVETAGKTSSVACRQGQDYIMVSGKFPRLTATEPISMLKEIISWAASP